jgi:hypothetical protein
MSPAATPSNPNEHHGTDAGPGSDPGSFGQLLHSAALARTQVLSDPYAILEGGELLPQSLCRYAAGKLEGSERSDMQAFLGRTPWAIDRVTALVRGGRPGGSPLAARVLAAAQTGQVDPYRAVAAALLESLGRADALDTDLELSNEADPVVNAACLLGHARREEAEQAFSRIDSLPPLADAARRVAARADEDEALVELLSAL